LLVGPDTGPRGLHRKRARDRRPFASSATPSRARSWRWSTSKHGSARGLISPLAFTTRCQGTRVSPEAASA